jgi:hypothetical protein
MHRPENPSVHQQTEKRQKEKGHTTPPPAANAFQAQLSRDTVVEETETDDESTVISSP